MIRIQVPGVYSIYIGVFSGMFYLLGFTGIADTISVVLSSLMTGGFSPVFDFSPYASFPTGFVVIVMMLLGAMSFIIHYKIVTGKFMAAVTGELIVFFLISAFSIIVLAVIYPIDIFTTVFHVLSASSGTGFSTIDFSNVPDKAKVVFILLMFIGGMSFSTAGGIKISRLILFFKSVLFTIRAALGSEEDRIYVEKNAYGRNEMIANLVLIMVSLIVVFGTWMLFLFSGFNLMDSMFEVVSAFGTVGLSAGIVDLSLAAHLKISLILLMIIGRVEAIPFLVAVSGVRAKQKKRRALFEDSSSQVPPGS